MDKFIEKDLQNLDILAAVRGENIVEYTLDSIMERVESKETVIEAIIDSSNKKKDAEIAIMEFITRYIEELVKDIMMVTEYVEKNRSKQMVFLFIGTHWSVIELQLYYVFVKKCAYKLGLKSLYCESPDFMNKVFERLAFRVMQHKKHQVTPGESWVNLQNCTLEIKSDGELVTREHRAEDFFTYVLPYVYNPEAECPLFHKFLDRVLPEVEMQTLLAEYVGYCFTKNLKLEKMLVLSGLGRNGKSTVLEIVTKVLGGSNVSFVSLSDLTTNDEKRSLADGKLANISSESRGDLDYSVLKRMVSGEETDMRKLYSGTHMMTHIPKLFTSYNRLPSPEYTMGFFRRWILMPFRVCITDDEVDVDLVKKLSAELPGILNWVLLGLKNVMKNKAFTKSKDCQTALDEYISNSNSALQFLDTFLEEDEKNGIKLSDIYRSYSQFCMDEELKKVGKKAFQDILSGTGIKYYYNHNAKYFNVKYKE